MLFNSFIFWIFLALVLPIYVFLKNERFKKIWLLLTSLFFYGYWEWKWLSLLIFSIALNFYLGNKLEKSVKYLKAILIFGISLNLGMLAVFKYFNFFIENLNYFFPIETLHLVLPIGISFYTFHAIGYLLDIYRKDIESTKSWLDFSLYMCFFPFLIAGPIVRAKHFLPQLKNKLIISKTQWQEAFFLISIGLFQKVMIGDACGRMVDAIFYDFSKYATFEIICATLLFSFQIYADFAGYSNIARGLGKLFGIEFLPNFAQPYFSKNIKEFWSRWHISLSSWLRDYLYIPLGGNKNGEFRTLRNLLLVMTLGGLWHGAGWNFVLWGLYHGTLLVWFRKWSWDFKNKYLNILFTFFLVTIGWFLFRIHSLNEINTLYHKLLAFEFGQFPLRYLKMVLSFGVIITLIDGLQLKHRNDAFLVAYKNKAFVTGIACMMIIVSFLYIFIKKPSPFIYFQF